MGGAGWVRQKPPFNPPFIFAHVYEGYRIESRHLQFRIKTISLFNNSLVYFIFTFDHLMIFMVDLYERVAFLGFL